MFLPPLNHRQSSTLRHAFLLEEIEIQGRAPTLFFDLGPNGSSPGEPANETSRGVLNPERAARNSHRS